MTINQPNTATSASLINWSTFNIAAGETVTFNLGLSSFVSWNFISDQNASTLNGALNATKGLVILQNPNGFSIGGTASINVHNLVMTTMAAAPTSVTAAGPWTFSAPTPAAQIVNYGQITTSGGGSLYLIASDIVNHGTITAPSGSIGLYAGETVLVSKSPTGSGLNAAVTLPQGSVDNEGNLIASAGTIAAMAQEVNQNGIVQANAALNVNGTIELVASDTLSLGAGSSTSTEGSSTSSGGGATLQAGNVINENGSITADGSTMTIMAPTMNLAGTIQANPMGSIAGTIGISAGTALNLLAGSDVIADNLTLDSLNITPPNPNSTVGPLTFANGIITAITVPGSIELGSSLSLPDSAIPASFNLSAGNDITLDSGVDVLAGQNWNVTFNAGTAFAGTPVSGSGGIYLNGTATLQAENGNINLSAANEVILGNGAVRTIGGGSIYVNAIYGGVNTGTNPNGFNFNNNPTGFYGPASSLGGISTAAGGNVDITAGGDVTSFPTTTYNTSAAGTGAFGEQTGNVTINAGGSVYGNFVVINGAGTINAGKNIGTADQNVALSLANNSSWALNAGWNPATLSVQNGVGNIYLQEALNPNGVFNTSTVRSGNKSVPAAGYHYFDYGPEASLTLNAGDGVNITGSNLPRISKSGNNEDVPVILPPVLTINAGARGVTLSTPTATDGNGSGDMLLSDEDIVLFPSPDGNLTINTTGGGSLMSGNASGALVTLRMSDSGQTSWANPTIFTPANGFEPFSEGDDASVPAQLGDTAPVTMNISGSMDNLILQVSKLAQINVAGDMVGCTFYGENLNPGDVTSLNVGGQIFNGVYFNSVTLNQGITPVSFFDLPPGVANAWDTVLSYALNPALLASQSFLNIPPQQIASILKNTDSAFPGLIINLAYDPATQTLTAAGPLAASLLSILEQPITVARYGPNGLPEIDPATGHLITDTITLLPGADVNQAANLYTASLSAPPLTGENGAYAVGGQGYFDVTAGSISLGNSDGILSVGNGNIGKVNYKNLTPYITSGATINVTADYLIMPASEIAALGGGDVNVNVTGVIPNDGNVSMDLGSQVLEPFEGDIMTATGFGLGIYTTGGGNITVNSFGTIAVDSSRIATFNGGNINITSYTGNLDAGSGGTIEVPINVFSSAYTVPFSPDEYAFANGIVAETLANAGQINGTPSKNLVATIPGDITINTPEGDIDADQGGILQESPGFSLPLGPTVTLDAGSPGFIGNINLGQSGVIGGTINATATGSINGLLISAHNANVDAQQSFSGTVLSGGQANVSASTSVSGTIIGAGGVNVGGGGSVTATLLGQNVSVNGGQSQSTLGNGANATATSQSAAQQSNQSANKQVAGNDDDEKKKKKKKAVVHVGRVTVILSTAVPGH